MRYGEAWGECDICGFEFPLSHLQRHYKTRKLVDVRCADEPSHADYLEYVQIPRDEPTISPQPVSNQGFIPPALP